MYLKFLWNLITRHINDYKNFKHYIELMNYCECDYKAKQQEYLKLMLDWRNRLGINTVGTVHELAKQNQEFEKQHPELFPGLNNN